MTPRLALPWTACLLVGITVVASADDRPPGLFESRCVDCHAGDEPEGRLDLSSLLKRSRTGVTKSDAEDWGRVLEQLEFGSMPPVDELRPKREEVETAKRWIRSELAAIGVEAEIDHRLRQPAYANLVDHERLFDGSVTEPSWSPSRLWRIHPRAYEGFLESFGRTLPQGGPLSRPFTLPEGKGEVANYAGLAAADSATLGQLMLNARQIADLQTVGFTKTERNRKTKVETERTYPPNSPASFTAILESTSPPTDVQLRAAVAEEFDIVLNRAPDEDEADVYTSLLRRAIDEGGTVRGLRTMAMAVLLRPEAIFRLEVGLGPEDEHGRRMLSPYELAHAIGYSLTDRAPDEILLGDLDQRGRPTGPSLLELARDGRLATREDVERVVTRLWDLEHVEEPRILRFFHEFFGYAEAPKVFKGDRGSRALHFPTLIRDADTLVMHCVEADEDVLRNLLTTRRFFVVWRGRDDYERIVGRITSKDPKPGDRAHAYFVKRTEQEGLRPQPQANPEWRRVVRFYNLDERTWDYQLDQPFEIAPGQRVGLLTHPAWLIAWSGNFDNDPIRRGKWIREHLLAGTIPDVPITVNAAVPEDPHRTLRDRLEVTRAEYCWKCHQRMDPLGLPFESYDDFGRFRTAEGLGHTKALAKPKATAPVVTTGEVIASGVPSLDGPVADVAELMDRLAGSERVRQSFVRHAFRYWMGRNEMPSDSRTLIAADRAYAENGGSFRSLVISLLTSDSFLYRK